MDNIEKFLPLILGIFVCLFGYRLKKIVFFVAWFLLGYIITTKAMPIINTNFPEIADQELWQYLLPVAGGLFLSLIGFSIEKICVALLTFGAVILIGINHFGISTEVITIAGVIGVIAAGVATMLMKPATIIITALIGASSITNSVFALMPELSQADYNLLILVGSTVIGTIFQFLTTKHVS